MIFFYNKKGTKKYNSKFVFKISYINFIGSEALKMNLPIQVWTIKNDQIETLEYA